jgi:hypothetical protein
MRDPLLSAVFLCVLRVSVVNPSSGRKQQAGVRSERPTFFSLAKPSSDS